MAAKKSSLALYSLISAIIGLLCAFVLLPLGRVIGNYTYPVAMILGSIAALAGTVTGILAITQILSKRGGNWIAASIGVMGSLISLFFFTTLIIAIRTFS